MVETRDLAYKDRFVRYLIQTLSDRFDTLSENATLPFVDQTSRIPLVYRINQTEYTQILSAIMTGADLAFPDIAHELELIWSNPDDYGVSEDFCLDFETEDSTMINYFPMNPFTEPETIPDGYLMPPFWVFGDVLPEFIGGLFDDLLEEITGYLPTDVLSTIGSFPILGGWDEIVGAQLPRFDISVDGKGILELHLLSVPFGGRALITIDEIPNIADIVAGLWLESDWLVDLDRDYTSIPPESLEVMIVEYPVETTGAHTVYVTMLPVVNDSLVPLSFGGGIRKITWCPDEIPDEPCEDCPELTVPDIIADETYFQDEYVPATFGEYYSQTVANETAQAALYDDTPQSIGSSIPVAAPNVIEKNSLCAAVHRFVSLYCSTKLCLIQSKNFIEILWTELAQAANNVYDAITNLMSPIYTPNLYSCFVDDETAITALQDESAIEIVACFLYDELKGVAMSKANFDAAVTSAATTLSGTAQSIACIMENDNSQSLYINMLEAYNVALLQDEVDCPCEEPTTYWMLYHDYEKSRYNTYEVNWNGGNNDGSYVAGEGWKFNVANVTTANVAFGFDLSGSFVVRATAEIAERQVSDGSGSNDIASQAWFLGAFNTNTLQLNMNVTFISESGVNVSEGVINPTQNIAVRSLRKRNRVQQQANDGIARLRVHKVVVWGLPDGSGNKPVGSVWCGNTLPTLVDDLFP